MSVGDGTGFKEICFSIMPFGGSFDKLFHEIYAPVIRAVGFEPIRADSLFTPGTIIQDIWELTRASRLMLADLTGKNANVLYELGLAHALGRRVVLLSQDIEDVPFDLKHLRVLIYSLDEAGNCTPDLASKLERFLRETLKAPRKATLPGFFTDHKEPGGSDWKEKYLSLKAEADLLSIRLSNRTDRAIEERQAERLIGELSEEGRSRAEIANELIRRGVNKFWLRKALASLEPKS